MGYAAVPPPDPRGSHHARGGNYSSSITNIGGGTGALGPRAGSIDLAVGVGAGLCLGGAAMFVVLMTRFRRGPRWRQHQKHGQGGRGFGYDGVRLHGGGGGGGGGSTWPRQRSGFPMRGRKGRRAGPKEVALELGRVGFEYDGEEARDFAAFKLQDEDHGVGGGSSSSSSVVPSRAVSSVHRRLGSGGGGGGGALLGMTPPATRREDLGAGSRLSREISVDEGLSPSPALLQESSEQDRLLGGHDEETARDGFGRHH